MTATPWISITIPERAKCDTVISAEAGKFPSGKKPLRSSTKRSPLRGSLMNTVMVTRLASVPPVRRKRLVDQAEDRLHLGVEIAGDVVAGFVAGRGLPGEPDGAAALGDDGGRIGARRLLVGFFEILGHRSLPCRTGSVAAAGLTGRAYETPDRGGSSQPIGYRAELRVELHGDEAMRVADRGAGAHIAAGVEPARGLAHRGAHRTEEATGLPAGGGTGHRSSPSNSLV